MKLAQQTLAPVALDSGLCPGQGAAKRRRRAVAVLAPLAVFLVAVALRLIFNLGVAEHRICHVGDGFFFLISGNRLLELADNVSRGLPGGAAGSPGPLLPAASSHSAKPAGVLSTTLVDRLLLDGPVVPLYLAAVEKLLGVPAGVSRFDGYALPLSLVNSIVDALVCLVIYGTGRAGFGRRAGLAAAIIYAFYPPAIVATSTCYSEPFAAFLLATWCCCLFTLTRACVSTWARVTNWAAFGILSGLVMLSRPAFVFLPPLVTALWWLVIRFNCGAARRALRAPAVAAGVCGLALVLSPWVMFTAWATGKPSLVVNRAPVLNLSMGNQLATDGWASYSPDLIPAGAGATSQAVAAIAGSIARRPLEFAVLYLHKLVRLWGGAFNDFGHSFALSPDWQDIYHQLLVFAGVLGMILSLCARHNRRHSQVFLAGCVLCGVVALHCLHLFFVSLSRHAFTAVPLLALLAASGGIALANSGGRRGMVRYGVLMAGAAAFFCARKFVPVSPLLASALPCLTPGSSVVGGTAAIWLAGWLALGTFAVVIVYSACRSRLAALVTAAVASGVAVLSFCLTLTDRQVYEWQAPLIASSPTIKQEIFMPAAAAGSFAPTALILIDAQAPSTPALEVAVNGRVLSAQPIPWLQFRPEAASFVEALHIQGEAAGLAMQSLRQWWVVPCPTRLLRLGETNVVTVRALAPGQAVFGDYVDATAPRVLPSLRRFSWTKGFTSVERGDSRLYEPVLALGSARSQRFDGSRWRLDDLSASLGRQRGGYRIHLLLSPEAEKPTNSVPQKAAAPELPLAELPGEVAVHGADPRSFQLLRQPASLPGSATGLRLNVAFALKGKRSNGSAFVAVELSGVDDTGRRQVWSSTWQPTYLPVGREWARVSWSDRIPVWVGLLKDLTVTVTASPFHADLLFLRAQQAVKRKVYIKDLRLTLMPDVHLPAVESGSWVLY